MTYKVTHTASAQGSGKLLASILAEFVKDVPGDAVVTVETKKALEQRDDDKWSLSAVWDGNSKPPSGLTYPPGVRGVTQLSLDPEVQSAREGFPQFWGTGHP